MSWENVPLGKCCEIVSGATPRRNVPEYWDGDIAWVTPKDISGIEGAILFDTPEYISKAGYKSCSAQILPKNSILFSSRAPIGLVAIAGREMCTNQGFKSLIPGPDVNSTYLYYCMKKYANRIAALGSGATFKEVSKEKVSSFSIPLPPLKEQKRIAAILDKADAIRRKRRQAIQLADEFLRSVFLDMFGDLINNSKGWPHARFGDICESRLGKMLDSKKQTGNHKRKYLRNANLQWDYFDLTDLLEMDFDEKDRETFSLKYGDLLICEGGEVGRAAIWRNELSECYFQKALHRVRLNVKKATPEFLLHLLWFFSRNGGFRDHATSATIAHLTGVKLKEMTIPLPPLALQHKFSNNYVKIKSIKEKYSFLHRNGQELFASLTQKAFYGEL